MRSGEAVADEFSADTELLALSREQPEAFGAFYRRHAQGLLRYFARRTLDPETAAELTAETFAEAFASRHRFRDRGSGAGAWLYGIARHELSRYLRAGAVESRARRRLGMPERDLSPGDYERIEELIDFAPLRAALADALDLLTEDQREAMRLRVMEERPYEEVARLLECTEATARARVSRGLRRITQVLEPTRRQMLREAD
jgi:RNA polymerase sigma-70 factor (ECF subfamily)